MKPFNPIHLFLVAILVSNAYATSHGTAASVIQSVASSALNQAQNAVRATANAHVQTANRVSNTIRKGTQTLTNGMQNANKLAADQWQYVALASLNSRKDAEAALANAAQIASGNVQSGTSAGLNMIQSTISNITALINSNANAMASETHQLSALVQKQLCDSSNAVLSDLQSTIRGLIRIVNNEVSTINNIITNTTKLVLEDVCEATATISSAVHQATTLSTIDFVKTQSDVVKGVDSGLTNAAVETVKDQVNLIATDNIAAAQIIATSTAANAAVQATLAHMIV